MISRSVFLFFLLALAAVLLVTPVSIAQNPPDKQQNEEQQSETWLDTLKKMQIRREEEEHKKLVKTAVEVKENAEALLKDVSGSALPKTAEKKLKEIEKGAKKIRTESGGSGDEDDDSPTPPNLAEALRQLTEASRKLQEGVEKTSRHVVSITVASTATEVIQLVKVIRGYLN